MLSTSRLQTLVSPIYRLDTLRDIEKEALTNTPPGTLMERAGNAACAQAIDILAASKEGIVLILAGPGNNGGDALVTARLLHAHGYSIRIALLDDPGHFCGDALAAWQAWEHCDGSAAARIDDPSTVSGIALVIDGLFGIGLTRPLPDKAVHWISIINTLTCPILALDVPSGLDADTGLAQITTVRATDTISFLGAKPGLYTGDGVDYCGRVHIENLGINQAIAAPCGYLNAPAIFPSAAISRARNSHKGSFGSVGVIGGNTGMVGAALLSSRIALFAGAGRIYVQLVGQDGPAVDANYPELMIRKSIDLAQLDALVIGPGLGQDEHARQILYAILSTARNLSLELVIDADALNLIAVNPDLTGLVCEHGKNGFATILTPHPLEAARLHGVSVKHVQADRVSTALALAQQFQSVVVLKGAGSIVADVSGQWVINPTGNPALASGGTGDVLAGLIGALGGQHWPAFQTACAAVWLHGRAADRLVAEGTGPIGLNASELLAAIRRELNLLAYPVTCPEQS